MLFESLQWRAPFWIGSGTFYTQDNAEFIAKFHQALRDHLGLEISYQGIRNETPYEAEWIKTLRRTLDRQGLGNVKIAAADQTAHLRYQIVEDMLVDPELAGAVYAVGDHYVEYERPEIAQELGKPLWAAAHTTQFVEPGWTYIDGGCGYFERYGSYVTFRSPDGQDFTIVAETMGTPYIAIPITRQEVEFLLSDDLPDKPVHVWQTGPEGYFKKAKTIRSEDRMIRITLRGESLYTLSTTTGQRKGDEQLEVPRSSPFPMPYQDSFDGYDLYQLPKYFIDQSGVFEIADRPAGSGQCLRQSVPEKGIEWHIHGNPEPYTVIGNEHWKDYEVTVEAHLDSSGWVSVLGRVTGVVQRTGLPLGYQMRINDQGNWEVRRESDILASGQAPFSPTEWQTIGLRFEGDQITVLVNGLEQGRMTDVTYDQGVAGFGCDWQTAWFDNFSVRPVGD